METKDLGKWYAYICMWCVCVCVCVCEREREREGVVYLSI